jgi:phosphoribosyl-AMP cyclohydrolase
VTDQAWLDEVAWNADGLVPAVAQDATTGEVLMLAWMSRESLERTLASGEATYWSRTRGRLWRKGESSGHVQRVREVRLDCDGDTVLLKVESVGGVACHTGRRRCFFRLLEGETGKRRWEATDAVLEPGSEHG